MARLRGLPPLTGALPPRVGCADRIEAERARDRDRRNGDNLRGPYSTKRWRDLRLLILERDGWTCRQTGVMFSGCAPAPDSPVVDYIRPHRGDLALFWDEANLQAVSKAWHDSEKQRIERAEVARSAGGGWV